MLALRCPDCATSLEHAHHRRLHVCSSCARRWMSRGEEFGGLRRLDSTAVRPEQGWAEHEILYLMPIWSIGRDGADAVGPSRLLVPAVGWSRMSLLLSFAERLNRNPAPWTPWSQSPANALSPGDVHVEDAFDLAEILALALDPGASLDAEGELAFGGAELLDWPCVRRSSQLVELVGGRAISERLAEGLVPITSAHLRPAGPLPPESA